jgi:hypothetical protein
MLTASILLFVLFAFLGATNGDEKDRSNNANLDEDNVLDPDID